MSGQVGDFKKGNPLQKRKDEAARIRTKFPDRIPIIVERAKGSKIPMIDKGKYLVPRDLSVGQFMYVLRRRVRLPAEQGIFLFVNRTMLPAAELLSSIYESHKDEDGFVYIVYSGENTFG